MKERPIIMSADMVRAILEDRKTQTRRIVKGIALEWLAPDMFTPEYVAYQENDLCPYGQVGDRLWVREPFVLESTEGYGYAGLDVPNINPKKYVPWTWEGEYGDYYLIPHYRATEPEPNIVPDYADSYDDRTRWSPAIFMPRWASRITLEITGVRVERLQEITYEDIKREGLYRDITDNKDSTGDFLVKTILITPFTTVNNFIKLWDSLNAKRGYSWEVNPWVWVLEFKKLGNYPLTYSRRVD